VSPGGFGEALERDIGLSRQKGTISPRKPQFFAVTRQIFAAIGMSKWFNHVTRPLRVELNEITQHPALESSLPAAGHEWPPVNIGASADNV
jgi:hypothetical protein